MNNTAEKPIDQMLAHIGRAALNIAALGHIVQDIALESFTEETTSDYLTRLGALGWSINSLGQQLFDQTQDTYMALPEQ